MHRLSLSVLSLLLLFVAPVYSTPLDPHIRVPKAERPADAMCGGDLDAPLSIEIDALSPQRRIAGGFVTVFGTVTAKKDIDGLRLRFESEGAASLFNPAPMYIGRAPAGVPVDFSLLARFGPGDEGAVHVWAESDMQQEDYRWSKRETLYAIIHRGRLYTGMGDYQRLQRIAIEDDVVGGIATPEQARAAAASLSRMPFQRDARPFVRREFNALEQRLNAIVGANPRSPRTRVGVEDHHGSNILVRGTIRWTDENGNTHPVFGASVDIRDDDTGFDETIVTVGTDVDGNYEAVVNNDDGIGAGNRDIYVRVRLENSLVNTRSSGLLGGTYVMESAVHDEVSDGSIINESLTAANTGTGPAGSVFQAATWIAVYARERNGGSISHVDVIWPNGDDGSFYDGDVQIEQADRWDWDTIHHEYGHFVMDELDIEDNPGGAHNIGECAADVRGDKSEGNRLAWGEGWPTFMGTAGQQVFNMAALNVPRVGDTGYDDLEDGSVSYDLEPQSNAGRGEDNELAVQRLLWDLFDGNNDGRDTISRSDQDMWDVIDAAGPETLSGGWAALRAGQSNATQILMGEIASDHQIGPTLTTPAEGATVSPGSAIFNWNPNVGCGSTFNGNSFDVVFFEPTTFATILTVPNVLTGSSIALSEAQYNTLASSGHQVLWGVEGRNTSSPATGPYLGETRQITVNRPPVADAGADQTVECTSAGTTAVSLNGTGSTDPDGDSLTYSWSAPGVVFNNASSATPTGNFPIGTTTVTLTVSDGIAQDSDTVVITVQDTTPPVMSCPADITVECTGNLGVQATDPQLAPFFSGVSATDLCDNAPSITNDAPAFFPIGETIVTFTAVDDHGNVSSCSAKVKVVDSKAPQISASVTPTSLWPANHKMVAVEASVTVTDECDPNPTFVLTSIVSNEPDDGLGDGDTANDIQGADFGTPDTTFELRAERRGVAPGRVYTITYTGSDSSGNTAQTQVQVTVPHSRR